MWFNRGALIRLFTNDPTVQTIANNCIYILIIAYTPDLISGSLSGIVRALDVQKQGSYYALGSYYLVAVPMAAILVFKVPGTTVNGLWIS